MGCFSCFGRRTGERSKKRKEKKEKRKAAKKARKELATPVVEIASVEARKEPATSPVVEIASVEVHKEPASPQGVQLIIPTICVEEVEVPDSYPEESPIDQPDVTDDKRHEEEDRESVTEREEAVGDASAEGDMVTKEQLSARAKLIPNLTLQEYARLDIDSFVEATTRPKTAQHPAPCERLEVVDLLKKETALDPRKKLQTLAVAITTAADKLEHVDELLHQQSLQVAVYGGPTDAIVKTAASRRSPKDKYRTIIVEKARFAFTDCRVMNNWEHAPAFLAIPVDVSFSVDKYYVKHTVNPFTLERLMMADPNREYMSEPHAKVLAVSLVTALDFLKHQDVVHGGIHPGSIEIARNGYPVLMRLESAIKGTAPAGLPKTARLRFEYTAPEVLRAGALTQACYASDIFSVGATLNWMLQGSTPYQGEDAEGTRRKIIDEETRPNIDTSKMTKMAATFIQRCVEKDPGKRMVASVAALYEEKWFPSVRFVNSLLSQTKRSPFLASMDRFEQKQKAGESLLEDATESRDRATDCLKGATGGEEEPP